jgi:hypothetical protein
MIAKSYTVAPASSDPRVQAGHEAERQVAFYLHRAFATVAEVQVLNGLRLVDPQQPEFDGRPGVCQIDHLILHRFGAFIIESKSVHGTVEVRGTPSDPNADEWVRIWRGERQGIASPLRQAQRQGEYLRQFLQPRRESLLGHVGGIAGRIVRAINGTDQRGFRSMPIQTLVAFSDTAIIKRIGGWKEPQVPFRSAIAKADTIADIVRAEMTAHRKATGLMAQPQGAYGQWDMLESEVPRVAAFLAEQHQAAGAPGVKASTASSVTAAPVDAARPIPAPAPPPAQPAAAVSTSPLAANPAVVRPACKGCAGTDLTALDGRYGPYWKCAGCGTNTSMPLKCGACGIEEQRGGRVRIRREGGEFLRECAACGLTERVWAGSVNQTSQR